MSPRRSIGFAISAIALAVNLVQAGIGVWSVEGGPFGGRINVLHASLDRPAEVFAGTERGGVFIWNGGGWSPSNLGLSMSDVLVLASDPIHPDTLFAGTGGGGVYRSFDRGVSWSDANSGLTNLTVGDLAFRSDGACLFAATTGSGIFRTDDEGSTWSPSNTGLTDLTVRSIAVTPGNDSILFAGTNDGVFRSDDGGETWAGASDGIAFPIIGDVAVHPVNESIVLAGTRGGGVYRSVDGGVLWTGSSEGMGNAYIEKILFSRDRPDTVWAATNHGFFRSFDVGSTWVSWNEGLPDTTVRAILSTNDTLYTGTYWGGIFAARPGDQTWTDRNEGLTNRFVQEIALSPHDPERIWAAAYGGLVRSDDRGLTWHGSFVGVDTFDLRTLALDPDDPNRLVAGAFYGGVFRTVDGGSTWAASNIGLGGYGRVTALRYKPDDGTVILCAGYDGPYKSVDGGATWFESSSGIGEKNMWGMATVSTAPDLAWAGTYGDGLWKSVDFGDTWVEVSIPEQYMRAVAIDPVDTATVYVGGYYQHSGLGGVWKTMDGGGSWLSKNDGLGNRSVWSLSIDPADPIHLVAGTVEGVYESFNGADSWSALAAGLDVPDTRWVAFAGRRLIAGTYGGSAPWFEDEAVLVSPAPPASDVILALFARPNPFNPVTNIRIEAAAGPLRLVVYDLRGRLVRVLHDERTFLGGIFEAVWNGTDEAGRPVPSGVYFSRVTSGGEAESGRLVLIR